jgi:hypothetical protein
MALYMPQHTLQQNSCDAYCTCIAYACPSRWHTIVLNSRTQPVMPRQSSSCKPFEKPALQQKCNTPPYASKSTAN